MRLQIHVSMVRLFDLYCVFDVWCGFFHGLIGLLYRSADSHVHWKQWKQIRDVFPSRASISTKASVILKWGLREEPVWPELIGGSL